MRALELIRCWPVVYFSFERQPVLMWVWKSNSMKLFWKAVRLRSSILTGRCTLGTQHELLHLQLSRCQLRHHVQDLVV